MGKRSLDDLLHALAADAILRCDEGSRTPAMQNLYPTNLELGGENRLRIAWSDGQVREYGVRELRDACPCASCREKRRQPAPPGELTVLSAAEIEPLKILGMQPVGSYAYSIRFSDGHDTGIYTFEQLRELGTDDNA